MIVLDTSAAIELLLALPLSGRVFDEIDQHQWQIAAPQLLIVEVLQVLRRRVAAGVTPLSHAEQAREVLHELNIRYYDHGLLEQRIWQLRENLSAYDAAFISLAEATGAPLLTSDKGLAKAPGHRANVCLVE